MRYAFFLAGGLFILLAMAAVVSAEEINGTSPADSYESGGIELSKGWNFISVPRRLAKGSDTASVFAGIQASGRSIWTFNPFENGWKDLAADDVISPLEGYWIYSDTPVTVPLSYTVDPLQVPPVKELETGWNMVGLSGTYPASARDTFLSIRKTWTEVIGWDAPSQRFEQTIVNGGEGDRADTRELKSYHAYWVYVTEPCTLASIGA